MFSYGSGMLKTPLPSHPCPGEFEDIADWNYLIDVQLFSTP
jgi:hypothetical protein